MIWSPYDISIILHHHTSHAPFPREASPAYQSTVNMLVSYGVLHRDGERWTTTKLGQALVEMWCSQPIPVAKYVDPRFVTSEAE
jgi:hypothetical protein